MQQAVSVGANLFGWQALYYPLGRRLIFNIPNVDGTFDQHVCNTTLPAAPWCRFVGMQSYCWGLYQNNLFFGGASGVVYQADIGATDSGVPVTANAQQAWNMFGKPVRKRITACRPILETVASTNFNFTLAFDYGQASAPVIGEDITSGTPWGSPWGSPWSRTVSIDTRWRIGGGTGQAVSFLLTVGTRTGVTWLRTDFRYETGNAL